MAQSGYNYQPIAMSRGTVPSAPPLAGPSAPSAADQLAPPSYEEAIRAPSYEEAIRAPGGRFSSLPSVRRPAGAAGGVTWHPSLSGGTADPQADVETGTVSLAGLTGPATTAAATATPPPATGGTADDPPSHQSLFSRIKDAKQTSSGICDFISKLFRLPLGCVIGPVVIAVLLVLVFGLPVTLLTVGFYHFFHCPVALGIPVWMVSVGVYTMVNIVYAPCFRASFCLGFSFLSHFAWNVVGAVFIYPVWESFEPRFNIDMKYCDYTLMMTAFVTINLMSVFTVVACVAWCMLGGSTRSYNVERSGEVAY